MLVFLNTICVAVEHYDQPEYLTKFLCNASNLHHIYPTNELRFRFSVINRKQKNVFHISIIYLYRLCRICVFGTIHHGGDTQNVWPWHSYVLPIII